MARMVGNSASEPDATGGPPLDAWTVAALMGGMEGLRDHLRTLADAMLEQARACGTDVDPSGVMHDAPTSIQ